MWFEFRDNWFQTSDFCHLWIEEEAKKGYYLMGRWRHTDEIIPLSRLYEEKKDLINFINYLLEI